MGKWQAFLHYITSKLDAATATKEQGAISEDTICYWFPAEQLSPAYEDHEDATNRQRNDHEYE